MNTPLMKIYIDIVGLMLDFYKKWNIFVQIVFILEM